jgi:GTP-binding protein Era
MSFIEMGAPDLTQENVREEYRSGYVTLIGEPNVGKSTLMNGLLKQKISIVTAKPQTTRHKILGIHSTDTCQIVFLDTPGIITPRYLLHEAMMRSASSAIADADVLMFMVDATSPGTVSGPGTDEAFKKLQGFRKPLFLVLNKIDLMPKAQLLPIIDAYAKAIPFTEVFPVSALRSEGTDALLPAIIPHLPVHPPYYPTDIVSEQSERFFVSEIIREKIFLSCREEVPYSTTVDVVEFKEREAGKWFVSADVIVERDSQKGILIGKRGAMLKEIGGLARRDIEQFLDHPVFLELHVKVREKWREKDEWIKRFGYGKE